MPSIDRLSSPDSLAKSSITAIQAIFTEEKLAKQVLSAAKRTTKKRASGDAYSASPAKRKKTTITATDTSADPAAIESSLALPESSASEQEITTTTLHTNRAPLVLAFALILLKYTMPSQPLSSRLSLAQAVVSMNSKTKALSLGIDTGTSAESEGWGQGQPKVRIMGRDVRVMKRWGYEWRGKSEVGGVKGEDSQSTVKEEEEEEEGGTQEEEPALWGLDLEALRSSNGPLIPGAHGANTSTLPIYHAESARAYLLKSFATPPTPPAPSSSHETPIPSTPSPKKEKKKPSASTLKASKEQNLALLLRALDLLYASWAHVLSKDELDRRAWAWYVAVRPEVEHGVAGWGGKGEVRLERILEMRRKG